MTTFFSSIISVFLSAISLFLSVFGVNLYVNGLSDIDYSTVKRIKFSSKAVLEDIGDGSYTIMQGGCTDGKYAYYCTLDKKTTTCSISKYDLSTFKEVARSNGVKVDHGNDITYNSDLDSLVVCHNAPNKTYVSFVNKKSLKITKTVEIPFEIYSITYNPDTKKYAVGISSTYNFAILDKNFKVIKKVKGIKTASTVKQGMDSDSKYIYFLLSSPNAISIYDWSGNHIGYYELNDKAKKYESENIFHIGDKLYIAYNTGTGKVYETRITAIY